MRDLSAEIAREFLVYDPKTGKLFWRKRARKWFHSDRQFKIWNTRFAEKEAFFSVHTGGYRMGSVFGRRYFAHRVIWLIQTGEWPIDLIDHIDRDRSNNAWDNLRQADPVLNGHNQGRQRRNTSGFPGVSRHTPTGKWRAQISINRCHRSLGLYDNLEDAAAAYANAKQELLSC